MGDAELGPDSVALREALSVVAGLLELHADEVPPPEPDRVAEPATEPELVIDDDGEATEVVDAVSVACVAVVGIQMWVSPRTSAAKPNATRT